MANETSIKAKSPTSPNGWWMAASLEKRISSAIGKGAYWENLRLIKASSWREAYRKALAFGTADAAVGNEAFEDPPSFLGITDLVPIYEPFEDGAELIWPEYPADDFQTAPEVFSEGELEFIH